MDELCLFQSVDLLGHSWPVAQGISSCESAFELMYIVLLRPF